MFHFDTFLPILFDKKNQPGSHYILNDHLLQKCQLHIEKSGRVHYNWNPSDILLADLIHGSRSSSLEDSLNNLLSWFDDHKAESYEIKLI